VAHVTSPGYLNGGGERARAGLTGGPDAVVTSEAIFTFEDECLTLSAVLEGRTADSVLEGFSIPVRRRDELRTLSPPDNSIVELVGQWTSEEHN
jgi:acyl CoA:acetate/3-ketoacid CoA transferase beta subunit